ncbi:unnamed protein product [Cuscuta europaea]|uniref:Uncharacterized protein n=1 Tax=Cuscuta europaea TaxID=41803 RepID=A0A9P0ZE31_CUSEU|nr:unnamed protein product [Cuscuta europaea]
MEPLAVGGNTVSIALFSDVSSSKELLEYMQAGTLEPEVALLNASLIPDVFPFWALATAHKTLVSKSRESTTRTLHSELVYNYSGSKHLALVLYLPRKISLKMKKATISVWDPSPEMSSPERSPPS